jgi:limonene 1,2-monooxygenase
MTTTPWPLRFGAFYAPFHPPGQNPTLALQYDLDRAVALDQFGYDEVWFGEHHSGGYELIPAPEVFIAAAAERTQRIKLGTGVTSLPYHHPLMVADRMVLLDHLTHGRTIFGTGPGALPTDAYMMGIDPVDQRPMMEESLEAILALLRTDEPVSRQTDWFTLRDAQLQYRPYSFPHFEVAVAAMVSPSGPRLAGTYDVSLLSLSLQIEGGFAAVGQAWDIVSDMATKAGNKEPDRRSWRVLGTMHIAETREQAIDDCTFGLRDFADYFGGGAGFVPLGQEVTDGTTSEHEFVEAYMEGGKGNVVIGTPDDAIEYIEGLLEQSGGFGTFLMLGHDWARPERTIDSYQLFAREVMPHFQGQLAAPLRSHEWAKDKRDELFGRAGAAIMNAIQTHVADQTDDGAGGGEPAAETHEGAAQ